MADFEKGKRELKALGYSDLQVRTATLGHCSAEVIADSNCPWGGTHYLSCTDGSWAVVHKDNCSCGRGCK